MVITRNTTAAAALAVMLAGCYGDVAEGPPFRAQILDLVQVDPETSEPSFALVTREFSYLDDLDALAGPELRLVRGGTLQLRAIAGSVVIDGRITGAESPRLRYVTSDGVAIARDYPTLAMLSAYYQYERVLEGLERVAGLDTDELASLMGQLEVFFEPAIVAEDGSSKAELVQKFNAFYVPKLQQFGLAQRSQFEEVPLSVNLQVIAHEFGHALFELTFAENAYEDCEVAAVAADPRTPGRFNIEYAISGMNEGFADFISFAYTGGTNAIAALPFDSVVERDIASSPFTFDDLDSEGTECGGAFYCIGSLFARALYDAMVELGYDPLDAESRGEFSRDVVTAMTTTQAALYRLPEDVVPAPLDEVAACEPRDLIVPAYDGAVSGAFLAAFATQMPAEARQPLCDAFLDHFGDVGFPRSAQGVCYGR